MPTTEKYINCSKQNKNYVIGIYVRLGNLVNLILYIDLMFISVGPDFVQN